MQKFDIRQNCCSTALLRLMCLCLIASGALVTFALECYMCDSAEDVECATKPGQQINVEECNLDVAKDDECVTVVTNGLTRRGCLSRLYPNKYCPEPCDRCNTSLCNRHIFPINRLRCYQCSGSECIDVTKRPQLLLPCPVYNENDRCYTNIVHLSNTLRGCERTNLPTTCPHVCLKCNYNGCNNEVTVTEGRCLQCTHNRNAPNPDCLRNQMETTTTTTTSNNNQIVKKAVAAPAAAVGDAPQCALNNATLTECVNKLMYGHRQNCFTYRNAQTEVVQRGCSTTMGFFPTGQLTECNGENCNRNCLDIACNICNATDTEGDNCRTGKNLKLSTCTSGTTACYSCEQDTQLRRGCADANFMPRINETCQLCRNADGCNRWPVRTCYRCNSLETQNCADLSNATLVQHSNCTHAHELCVSTVLNRLNLVYTVRGCSSEVPECSANDPYCVRCNGSLCNNQVTMWQQHALTAKLNETALAAEAAATTELGLLHALRRFLNVFN